MIRQWIVLENDALQGIEPTVDTKTSAMASTTKANKNSAYNISSAGKAKFLMSLFLNYFRVFNDTGGTTYCRDDLKLNFWKSFTVFHFWQKSDNYDNVQSHEWINSSNSSSSYSIVYNNIEFFTKPKLFDANHQKFVNYVGSVTASWSFTDSP